MPKLLNMLRRKKFSLMYCQGNSQQKNDCKHPTLEFQIAFMCHNHKLRNKRPLVGALEQASFAHIFQYPSLWCCLKVGPHSFSSSSSELGTVTIFFMIGLKTATKLHEMLSDVFSWAEPFLSFLPRICKLPPLGCNLLKRLSYYLSCACTTVPWTFCLCIW